MLNKLSNVTISVFDISSNSKKIKQNKFNRIAKFADQRELDSFFNSLTKTEQTVLGTTIQNTKGKAISKFDKLIAKWFPRLGKPTLNPIEEWLLSGNKTTDKKNDGKISFISKIVNIGEGALKAFSGTLYNIFTSPKRLASTIGTGLVLAALASNPITAMPVVALGIFAGVSLVGNGIKTIYNASKDVKYAQKDSEAKDAYEKIGQGLLEIGAGAVSGVQSGKILKTNIPKLKPEFSKISTKAQEVVKNPKTIIENFFKPIFSKIKTKTFDILENPKIILNYLKLIPSKIGSTVKNICKTIVSSILDICNIKDDIK